MCPTATISATRLMELLTPTLGWDKSSELVSTALARRGRSHGELSIDEALALLETFSQSPGLVGIAARFVATRVQAMRNAPGGSDTIPPSAGPGSAREPSSRPAGPGSARMRRSAPPPRGSPSSIPADDPSSSRARPASAGRAGPDLGAGSAPFVTALELREIVDLFGCSMSRETSAEVITAAARRLGLSSERIGREQALELVESLAEEAGIVGLSARFAKARLLLRFPA